MIIELFGPPGAGKTTSARAIAARVQSDRCKVDLRLSYRPGEQVQATACESVRGTRWPFSDAIHRLARPAIELLSVGGTTDAERRGAAAIASMLPRNGIFRSLRWNQYLRRLSNAWFQASTRSDIVIFDQAFVQAILSLWIIQPDIPIDEIAAVVDAIPQSDLIIRVDAPADQIERRVAKRQRSLGFAGRLLEEEQGNVQEQVLVTDRLSDLLARAGRALLQVQSTDDGAFAGSVSKAEHEILRMLRVAHHGSTESGAHQGDLPCPIERSSFG